MKATIHPKWYPNAKVSCACGNEFTIGATFPELSVEICANCHPFYTGQMKFIDAAGRVDAFRAKQGAAGANFVSKNERRRMKKQDKLAKELERPESLAELRKKN